MTQKRVLAIHDISCFGRCSLTVALPILSAAGIECTSLPTAVLSTHTGGFEGFTYRDLTADILPISDHWQTLDIEFNAIYTGFLGSFEQIDIIKQMFERHGKCALKIVDPVMADNGQLYAIFPESFPSGMASLCEKADVVMPNITEATLMLGEPYVEGPYSHEYIEDIMKKLAALGPRKVILTGVYYEEGVLGAATYDADSGETSYASAPTIPGYYHGTGDVFGSAITAALVDGVSLERAARIAVDFTVEAINRTVQDKTDIRFGVNFEQSLPSMQKALGLI